MKSFKMFSVLLAFFATLAATSFAQVRTKQMGQVQQGTFADFGGTNLVASDSLQVTDSIAYVIPVVHGERLVPYISWQWVKIGAGTATVTLNVFAGNDPTNLYTVKAGAARAAYVKTYTLSASGSNEISFDRDTAFFEGRYLKLQFITSSTASVKGKLVGRVYYTAR